MYFISRPLRILLATNGLYYLSGAMLGPIYAIYVEDIGGNLLDASFAFSVFAVAAGITSYISGKYTDRVRENELIIALGYLIVSIGNFSYILVDSIWHLMFAQAIIGLGASIYSPAFDALFSIKLRKGREGFAWGAWEIMFNFTTALGAIIGGLVATYFGFKMLFIIMGSLTLFSSLYIYLLPRRVL